MKQVYSFLFALSFLFIQAQCPTFSVSGGSQLDCLTTSLSLTANNTSTLSGVTYTWVAPSFSFATGTTYTCSSPGIYTVAASAPSNSCISTQTLSVTQNTIIPSGYITPTSGTVSCSLYINTYTAIASPSVNIYIQWFNQWLSPVGAVNNSPCILSTGSVSGVFYANFTDIANGCSLTRTLTIYSNTVQPTVSISGTGTLCSGSSTNLTANGAGTYTWNTGSSSNPLVISPTVTTTYSVTGTSSVNGCTNTATYTQSVAMCAGINELESLTWMLKVYPNPANDILNIGKEPNEIQNSKIQIFNAFGQIILVEEYRSSIDISRLAKGLYYLVMIGPQNQMLYSSFSRQ